MANQSPRIADEKTSEAFDEKMHDLELKRREGEAAEQAKTAGLPYINLKGFPIAPEALSLISQEEATKTKTVCFLFTHDAFRLATVDPAEPELENLRTRMESETHASGSVYVISEQSLAYALTLYDKLPKIRPLTKGVSITEEELNKFGESFSSFRDLGKALEGLSVSDQVALMVAAAFKSRASDIHVEAEEKATIVRFRVDGTLITVAEMPREVWHKLSSRIKLVATLKINVVDKPQDGRFTIFMKDDKVDVRVSTIPTAYGESIVMRLLRSTAVGLAFEDLGLRGEAFNKLLRAIAKPNGMIITTGPTGSGKTTTLYAVLNKLNQPDVKIITMEDPIEYRLTGISQSQVEASKDYSFAKGLRSILRQDPDVVMVGEIRDFETADIAIQAALTGHLVLSTLHTNNAAGAIPRFLSMGVKPFLLAPSLDTLMAQRLVRKICPDCKEETTLSAEVVERVKTLLGSLPASAKISVDLNAMHFYKGKGCSRCFDVGYKGRMGIYEVMDMNPEIAAVISAGDAPEHKLQEIAVRQGMVTMVQDGLLKALEGITSVEEVFSVAQ